MEKLKLYLENFPKTEKDTFERLQAIATEAIRTKTLQPCEKIRLKQELSVIEDTNTASVFLFFYDVTRALEGDMVASGATHCSYLCYALGITKVNPFDYNLPFERYFGRNRAHLPFVSFAVTRGKKGKLMQYLKARFGADKIARLRDRRDEYVLSKESLLTLCSVEGTILRAESGEEVAWHEDISSLTGADARRLGLYTFTAEEKEIGEYRAVSDEELYREGLSFFEGRDFREDAGYSGVKEAEKVFAKTDGKLIFQEQFYEICVQLLGVTNERADRFRKDLIMRKREQAETIRGLFVRRLGEDGGGLFEYLSRRILYAVCKAYVIGLTFLK